VKDPIGKVSKIMDSYFAARQRKHELSRAGLEPEREVQVLWGRILLCAGGATILLWFLLRSV
jgi:hypothetical protein